MCLLNISQNIISQNISQNIDNSREFLSRKIHKFVKKIHTAPPVYWTVKIAKKFFQDFSWWYLTSFAATLIEILTVQVVTISNKCTVRSARPNFFEPTVDVFYVLGNHE